MGVSIFLLRSAKVQTFLTHKMASYYSDKLQTKVTVGAVDVEFFKKLVLRDVYVQDLHKDTLLFFNALKLDIEKFSFKENLLHVSELEFVNPTAKLILYKGENNFNFQFLVDAFSGNDTLSVNSAAWNLKFNNLSFQNLLFVYKDENDTEKTKGMNYFDLLCTNANGKIKNIYFEGDTIYFNIDKLSAHEKCGFILNNLTAEASISPIGIVLKNTTITTPESHVKTDFSMLYKKYADFPDFIPNVKMAARIDSAVVQMEDIAFFAPELKGMRQTVSISGDVVGKVGNLKCKNIQLKYGTATHFDGNAELTGLPNTDDLFLHIEANQLVTVKKDIEKIPLPPFTNGETLKVPDNIATLGHISFKGKFTGFLTDFVAYGKFSTALGSFSSDLFMRKGDNSEELFYKGKIKSQGFNVGKLIGSDQLGVIALNTDIDGSGLQIKNANANLKGFVTRLDAMGYTYNNIKVEALLSKKIFDGTLAIADENLTMKFTGNVDFTQELPLLYFNADIQQANLTKLNLLKADKDISLSSQLNIRMQGTTIDDMIGNAEVKNTLVKTGEEKYTFEHFSILANDEKQYKHIKVTSDFLNCDINGKYVVKDLTASFQNLLTGVLPSYFSAKQIKHSEDQQFDLKARFGNNKDFTKLFLPQLEIAEGTIVKANYNSLKQDLVINLLSPRLKIYGNKFHDVELKGVMENKALSLNINSTQVNLTDSLWLKNFSISTITQNDSSKLNIKWNNNSIPENRADINGKAVFSSVPEIKFSFQPSEVVISDSLWSIDTYNLLVLDTTCLYIHNMEFFNNMQRINLSGNLSKHSNDSMIVTLSQFNLVNLNRFFLKSGLKLNGVVNGRTSISDIFKTPALLSNTTFTNLKINNEVIGNGSVKTIWDSHKDALSLNGVFGKDILPDILFSGFYYPKKNNSIDLNLTLRSLNLELLQPFVKEYCKDFSGTFAGNITAKGTIDKPEISGKISVDAKKISVNYLGTHYSFKHDIIVESNSFGIENMLLYDQIYEKNIKGNTLSEKDKQNGTSTAVVNGKVYHTNFKKFQLDIDIVPQKFMVLNTYEDQNELYYGQAYVTGPFINIFGYIDNIIYISANVKSDKVNIAKKSGKTKLFIPLSGTSEISTANFITFVSHDKGKIKKEKYKADLTGIQLDFNLEMTTDAEVQLIFDQKIGDVIKARGNGVIKMEINTLGKFNMFGNYTVENGDYLFTLQNIINKHFDIEQGGTLKWSGNPYDADINLKASYKLKTALSPLFPSDSTGTYKRRYPIDCNMLLTNKLMSPDIVFDIDLPTVNEGTRRDVRNIVNSDIEMNRQVFSLMVLGGFVTPQSLSGTSETSNAGKTTSSELLSNQLSNMLSKVSNDFDLGVKYRAGDKVSNQELQLALSTQLFNNRLSIDGNFGVSSSVVQHTNTLVGDVNLEYKLTDDGKYRLRAFNRTNDNAFVNLSSPYTQGISVFYREEFNTVADLYKYYLFRFQRNKKTPMTD